ncbi:MAG: fused MFS/spermidine synthase, partial [Nitrospiria bacterium]
MSRDRRVTAALAAAFFLSGAAGLMYQVVWGRLLVLVFGSTTIAISTVLTVFMGGLALGAWLGGRWIDRVSRPLIVYAAIEAAIALFALIVPWALDRVVPIYRMLWEQWSSSPAAWMGIRFAVVVAVLAIPTVLMGATLPVMSRALARDASGLSSRVAAFYALNTAGAIAGASTTGFLWLPAFGVTPTLAVAAACNLAAGAAAWMIARRGAAAVSGTTTPPPFAGPAIDPRLIRWVSATLVVSGAAALVNEVAWSRALSLVLGSSVYAFAAMLTTFLFGLAAGAASGVRLARRWTTGLAGLGSVQLGVGAASLLTIGLLSSLPLVLIGAIQQVDFLGPRAVPVVQFALAFSVMALPAYGFGLVLPAAIHALVRDPRTVGGTVGRLYAANTVGAIAGAFAAGFLLVPRLGVQATLLAAAGAC